MNTLEIPSLGKQIHYPSCWEECTTDQVLYIFRLAPSLLAGKMSRLDFLLAVFLKLSGIPVLHPDLADRMLSAEQRIQKYENIYQACQTIDFMFEKQDDRFLFNYTCLSPQLPLLRSGIRKLYPPATALFNLSFGEYRVAADMFAAYKNNDSSAGDKLCAVLYRPVHGKYKERLAFDVNECMYRAGKLRLLPEVKMYVAAWFDCCDKYIKTGDIQLEGRIYNLSCLFSAAVAEDATDDTDKEGNLGLMGIKLALAESGTFGSMEDVDKANLYDVLLKLYQWYRDNEKLTNHDKHKHS